MSKLNPVATKWVKALRSGKYKQTTGTLTKVENGVARHCCLGVLCQLAVAEGIVKAKTSKSGYVSYGGTSDLLPPKVQKWAGLKTHNGSLDSLVAGTKSLAAINDYPKKSFKFIARVIEQKVKELFE